MKKNNLEMGMKFRNRQGDTGTVWIDGENEPLFLFGGGCLRFDQFNNDLDFNDREHDNLDIITIWSKPLIIWDR